MKMHGDLLEHWAGNSGNCGLTSDHGPVLWYYVDPL
jgi:hypothetical protein